MAKRKKISNEDLREVLVAPDDEDRDRFGVFDFWMILVVIGILLILGGYATLNFPVIAAGVVIFVIAISKVAIMWWTVRRFLSDSGDVEDLVAEDVEERDLSIGRYDSWS